MGEFFYFVISFHIKTEIQSIIIGNPEFISIAIKNIVGILEPITPQGVGNRSAGLIHEIRGKAKTSRKFIVGHYTQIMGLIVIGREIISTIDLLFTEITVEFYIRARIGVCQPTVQFAFILTDQEFKAIRLTKSL